MSSLRSFIEFSGNPSLSTLEGCKEKSAILEEKMSRYRKYPDGALILLVHKGGKGGKGSTADAALNRDLATYLLLERGVANDEIEHILSRM